MRSHLPGYISPPHALLLHPPSHSSLYSTTSSPHASIHPERPLPLSTNQTPLPVSSPPLPSSQSSAPLDPERPPTTPYIHPPPAPRRRHSAQPFPSLHPLPRALANAAYQLEHLGGGADVVSAPYLSGDGGLAHAAFNGPATDSASGEWLFDENAGALTMQAERRFDSIVGLTSTRVLWGDVDVF